MATRFESTRGKSANAGFDTVLLSALADNGGRYLPTDLPRLIPEKIRALRQLNYRALASRLLPQLIGNHIPADGLRAPTTPDHPAKIVDLLEKIREFSPDCDLDLNRILADARASAA